MNPGNSFIDFMLILYNYSTSLSWVSGGVSASNFLFEFSTSSASEIIQGNKFLNVIACTSIIIQLIIILTFGIPKLLGVFKQILEIINGNKSITDYFKENFNGTKITDITNNIGTLLLVFAISGPLLGFIFVILLGFFIKLWLFLGTN